MDFQEHKGFFEYDHHRLKSNARRGASTFSANAIGAALITMLLGGGGSFFSYTMNDTSIDSASTGSYTPDFARVVLTTAIAFIVVIVVTICLLMGIAYAICIANVIQVGACRFFLKNVKNENPSASLVFSAFREFDKVVPTMFFRDLYCFLWSLLLIVPGIVKAYEYSMVPYIKAECPEMPTDKVLKMSSAMTDGHKWDLFYLDLSFIGWFLLSAITLTIAGIFYVNPYYYAAKACAYEELKAEAVSKGKLIQSELTMIDNV